MPDAMALLNALSPSLPPDVRLMNATTGLLLAVAAAALAGLAFMWVARQPLFVVRSISIEGDMVRNSVSTIRANATPRLSGNFFTMDLAAGRRAFESVPWVRQAVVNRIWPNRLAVRLQEHRAAALWIRDGAEDRIVNTYGEVFEANLGDVEDEALPTLSGPDGTSSQMLGMLIRLRPVLAPMPAQIETLSLSGRGSWRVELDTGAEVELGRGSDDEVVERTQRFVATVGQVISRYERPLEYADLRHNEAYAVRLRGISTTSIPADTGPAAKPKRK
jgi:cell division protein FtsQ